MKMKKKILSAAVMAALAVGSAQADRVSITGDAHGQVLLFPYYTTQGNNETLLTITNTTDKGKAVKVSFREAFNLREVLAFNIYLAPFDVWVGKVQDAPDGGAQLYTPDNSCSTLDTNPQNMLDYDYTDSRSDGAPEGPARKREGFFAALDMGEIDSRATALLGDDGHWYADDNDDDTPAPPDGMGTVKVKVWDRNNDGIIDVVHKNGAPNYCQGINLNISSIWKDLGTNYGFKRPSGDLIGTMAVINVQDGSEASVASTGVSGMFLTAVHNFPSSGLPDFRVVGSPNDGSSHSLAIDWDTGDGGYMNWKSKQVGMPDKVDGLSAVLMAGKVFNDYTVNPAAEAETAWIVTFPTKSHYVDPKFVADVKIAADAGADDGWHVDDMGNPKPYPPFTTLFDGKACEPISFKVSGRDGEQVLVSASGVSPRQSDDEGASLCYGVNVIQFGSTSNVFDAKNTVTRISDDVLPALAGWMSMDLTGNGHEMKGNGYGWSRTRYEGLPVIGFKATVMGNSNVGIGASYAVATSHGYKHIMRAP